MNRNSFALTEGEESDQLASIENLLVLEKSLERNGQEWIENLNVIEQLLVRVTDRLGQDNPNLRCNFIIRRFPTYLAPYINRNEYGIVLSNVHFTLQPIPKPRSKILTDRPGTTNFGQIEIFYRSENELLEAELPGYNVIATDNLANESNVLNENQAYCSHEIFKRFTAAFIDAYQLEIEVVTSHGIEEKFQYSGNVQLIGPHLIGDLQETPEVSKIFSLKQNPLSLPKDVKDHVSVKVNYLKSTITVCYCDTEVVVRPCLFQSTGFSKVNSNILERIPLHHHSYLTIAESLNKGFILCPTSFETLWTLQFWTSESHIISIFHPSSVISRVFKLYASFCLNPAHFWEVLNSSFLISMDADGSMQSSMDSSKGNLLIGDFVISSFLYELERFSSVEDWAPRNFSTRLMHLFRSAVDSYDKGFHSHYYTKINVLRGMWKNSADNCDKDEKSVLRELDDITESQENLDDYGDTAILEMDDLEDDFGLHFDELETIDDESLGPRPTSETIYKSLTNPYQPRDNLASCSSPQGFKFKEKSEERSERRPTTLSKVFGSSLAKRLGNKLSRRHSDASNTGQSISLSRATGGERINSMTDIALGFEESIAHMRRPDSIRLRFKFQDSEPHISETSFYKLDNNDVRNKRDSLSSIRNRRSFDGDGRNVCSFQNMGFKTLSESIYSLLLQNFSDLPPSDYLSDQELTADLEKQKKTLESQEELINMWGKVCNEFPEPKYICPHIFTQRQIQYLSLIIQAVSKCSPNMVQIVKMTKVPAWEISGDILRTVLHQMRAEVADSDSIREKQRPATRAFSQREKDHGIGNGDGKRKRSLSMKFSLRKKNQQFSCKHDIAKSTSPTFRKGAEPQMEIPLSLEEPEIAATHRLLEWLWQLRCSEIGRLSSKAYKYIELLYKSSLINSHFLEQLSEDKLFKSMALKSAVAVTRIMENKDIPVNAPLCAAMSKGWLWAEMILSLASWNKEKGLLMQATLPSNDDNLCPSRTIDNDNAVGKCSKKQMVAHGSGSLEPDIDAATLAFHSEIATPIGWNDFEDPRRPGPYAASVLIFSSTGYYKMWELMPGNIVQVLVRLQKFNSLQHVGSMLNAPHRKTALNEVRKLNKSLSFRIYNFDENVMSKTFKRLASLRNTRSKLPKRGLSATNDNRRKYYTCRDVGCSYSRNTIVTSFNGTELECTKL